MLEITILNSVKLSHIHHVTHLNWFDDIDLGFKSVFLLNIFSSIISNTNLNELI
jgi:hypothetical protein